MKALDKAICCNQYNKWIHIKCNILIITLYYEDLKIRDESWYCKACIQEVLLYSKKVNSNISSNHSRIIHPNHKNLL